jgi:aldehyde:ferredoxin oxidoreductase
MAAVPEQVVLSVDLTSGDIVSGTIGAATVREFVGGRGVGAKLLYSGLKPGTDPLSADNPLIFSSGALSGTLAPAAARTTVLTKSPATNRYLKCSAGGHWGAELRYAGYDHIVITGAAPRPVYLWIDGDTVQIRDATHLWGKGTREAEGIIKGQLDDDGIETAIIGPASENGVLSGAIIISRFHTAARGGIGTVMGAKKLKAIAVRGARGIPLADPDQFMELSRTITRGMAKDGAAKALRQYGVVGMMGELGRSYLVGARNFREAIVEEAERLSGQRMAELGYFRAGLACIGCGIGCRHFLSNDSSPYGPLREGIPEIEPVIALGSQCGVTDTDAVLQASALCDDLGLDVLSTGFSISWAMECYEKGLISPEQADGLELRFGNAVMMLELIGRIARREGLLGDLLADGTCRAAEEVGRDSWKWAIQARGLEQSSPDSRAHKGYALAFATNPRGPDHLTAMPMAELGGSPQARALVTAVCGDERYAVPHLPDKRAELVRWHEDCQAASDALGICIIATAGTYSVTPEHMAQLLSAARGVQIDAEELMESGRRIVTLERCFNVREGDDRRDEDHLPWRMMHEALEYGPNAGLVTSPEEMDQMLDEYYGLHGWDATTGWPTAEVLAALGLEDLCCELGHRVGGEER